MSHPTGYVHGYSGSTVVFTLFVSLTPHVASRVASPISRVLCLMLTHSFLQYRYHRHLTQNFNRWRRVYLFILISINPQYINEKLDSLLNQFSTFGAIFGTLQVIWTTKMNSKLLHFENEWKNCHSKVFWAIGSSHFQHEEKRRNSKADRLAGRMSFWMISGLIEIWRRRSFRVVISTSI